MESKLNFIFIRKSLMRRRTFRSTYLLYLALVLGQIVFCLYIVFLITQPDSPMIKEGSDYPFLALLIVFLASGAAWYMNQLRLKTVTSLQANFEGKLMHYKTTVLLRAAMVEAGNLFCLILALLEQSLTPILYFCMGMIVFLYFKPSVDEVVEMYKLNNQEREELLRQLESKFPNNK